MKRIDRNEVVDLDGTVTWFEEVEVDIPDPPRSVEEVVDERLAVVDTRIAEAIGVSEVSLQQQFEGMADVKLAGIEVRLEDVARIADIINVDTISNMAQAREAIRQLRDALKLLRKSQ